MKSVNIILGNSQGEFEVLRKEVDTVGSDKFILTY